jgi:PilZ domain
MSNSNQPESFDDQWFSQDSPKSSTINQRKSTRVIRKDIGVTLRQTGLLSFKFFKNNDLPVKPIDISSRGILIETDMRLSLNKKVLLIIRFADFKEYEIPSTVVRKSTGDSKIYGIKFDSVNNRLANKLLRTQKKLTFK